MKRRVSTVLGSVLAAGALAAPAYAESGPPGLQLFPDANFGPPGLQNFPDSTFDAHFPDANFDGIEHFPHTKFEGGNPGGAEFPDDKVGPPLKK